MHVKLTGGNLRQPSNSVEFGRVGYFPERQPDELAYSMVARARAILFPEESVKYACKRLFGHGDYSIGGLLPNNSRLLQMRIPPVAAASDELFIDGSIYHVLAPLMDEAERSELRQSIVDENARGRRGVIRRPGIHGLQLRYCVICARRDASLGRPLIWRVVPNFPGVNCCNEHGCTLITTEARLAPNRIHVPADYIQLDILTPPLACNDDQRFAADVQWVYAQKSSILPGFHRLGRALREVLLQFPQYVDSKGKLSAIGIAADLGQRMESTAKRLDPALLRPGSGPVLCEKIRYPLARYSLLAGLANLRLEAVFQSALAEPELWASPGEVRRERITGARRRLAELVAQNPAATRTEIIAMDIAAADVMRRNDPAGYEIVMPPVRRQGRNSSFDWKARDLEVHARIMEAAGELGREARTSARILERCGYSKRLFEKAHGRLPWSKLLVVSLVDGFWRSHGEQTHFPF